MHRRLHEKVALVTGGGTGIGAATAQKLALEGAHVAICGRRREPLEETQMSIADAGGSCYVMQADVSDEVQVDAVLNETVKHFGRLDILVNNAFQMVAGEIEGLSTEDWRRSFSVTLDAAFFATRRALQIMGKQDGGGVIVNISSIAGHGGQQALAGYSASKAALENFSKPAAVEGAPIGVRVNVVAPGVVATEPALVAFADPKAKRAMEGLVPLGRFGDPNEIAEAVLFLASDEASYITGSTLVVDGGQQAAIGAPRIGEDFERG
jgi:meso-butanediol dehydrogenase/(S,S)-butanediol dehydrogenase/diacetyl reductase